MSLKGLEPLILPTLSIDFCQPRTLHLLQSPYDHVNLAEKESDPRRRRFGMGRFRNREAERLNCYSKPHKKRPPVKTGDPFFTMEPNYSLLVHCNDFFFVVRAAFLAYAVRHH